MFLNWNLFILHLFLSFSKIHQTHFLNYFWQSKQKISLHHRPHPFLLVIIQINVLPLKVMKTHRYHHLHLLLLPWSPPFSWHSFNSFFALAAISSWFSFTFWFILLHASLLLSCFLLLFFLFWSYVRFSVYLYFVFWLPFFILFLVYLQGPKTL